MIGREHESEFVLIKQHDHALIAGEFARHFKPEYIIGSERWEEVIYSVVNHDRGWIDLDDVPFWNDAAKAPYTFIDFPIAVKLAFYQKGIDEIEANSRYAALLSSMHYFKLLSSLRDPHQALREFLEEEAKRQYDIKAAENIKDDDFYFFHLFVLEMCDDLSLYLILNEPGTDKAHEHPWYRYGLQIGKQFAFTNGQPIRVFWKNDHEVCLDPYPFAGTFKVTYPYRKVSKADIAAHGTAAAYHSTKELQRTITITEA